jgi:hypothetical protein
MKIVQLGVNRELCQALVFGTQPATKRWLGTFGILHVPGLKSSCSPPASLGAGPPLGVDARGIARVQTVLWGGGDPANVLIVHSFVLPLTAGGNVLNAPSVGRIGERKNAIFVLLQHK